MSASDSPGSERHRRLRMQFGGGVQRLAIPQPVPLTLLVVRRQRASAIL